MKTTIGLMSGTSLDGIDAAIISTDGEKIESFGDDFGYSYDPSFRAKLRSLLGKLPQDRDEVAPIEQELTRLHGEVVKKLIQKSGMRPQDIDYIGFHGHTITHLPDQGLTWQIGDGQKLAQLTGIPVISDFRSNDVACGGEGAPLVPVFHRALADYLPKPLCILNIGGVANVSWIGLLGQMIAFDIGPGNALIDDWVFQKTGKMMDDGGQLAKSGTVNEAILEMLMDNPYFQRNSPKSLDRNTFSNADVSHLSTADGAATLVAFTAQSVACSVELFPQVPIRWLVTGGGRHNQSIMASLRNRLTAPVDPVEVVGWRGDALEAQAFAYLAVRSVRGLAQTFPGTTGVAEPSPGGVLWEPES